MANDQPVKPKNAKRSLSQLQAQVKELTEALQRERADATNIRRQYDEQLASLQSAVKANVVRELLPVIDNFERALKHMPPTEAYAADSKLLDWIEGVKKVLAQFEKVLADLGVTRIPTSGQAFDPRYHEAVSMEEGDGSQEIVSEELQAGYRLGEDVIRHAMVHVKLQ